MRFASVFVAAALIAGSVQASNLRKLNQHKSVDVIEGPEVCCVPKILTHMADAESCAGHCAADMFCLSEKSVMGVCTMVVADCELPEILAGLKGEQPEGAYVIAGSEVCCSSQTATENVASEEDCSAGCVHDLQMEQLNGEFCVDSTFVGGMFGFNMCFNTFLGCNLSSMIPKDGAEGDSCFDDSHCASGRCEMDRNPMDGVGTCTATAEMGSTCNEDSDCATGHCDWTFKCSEFVAKEIGSICAQDDECASGHCNWSFQCAEPVTEEADTPEEIVAKEIGSMCTQDDDCASGNCNWSFQCAEQVELKAAGSMCSDNDDCASGSCSWSFTCN